MALCINLESVPCYTHLTPIVISHKSRSHGEITDETRILRLDRKPDLKALPLGYRLTWSINNSFTPIDNTKKI
uniref:Uncharacterized protein n=1 Tax=Anguilla anguilla TaxID=7936 RepID=A0A0E9WZC8_ANGAN